MKCVLSDSTEDTIEQYKEGSKEVLIKSRKKYQKDLIRFDQQIYVFLINNEKEIDLERAHLMY